MNYVYSPGTCFKCIDDKTEEKNVKNGNRMIANIIFFKQKILMTYSSTKSYNMKFTRFLKHIDQTTVARFCSS